VAVIFEPFKIKNVAFKNRVLRSSLGGRTSHYDGSVSSAWQRLERIFAENGLSGLISSTFDVDDRRHSPLEFPKITEDRFIAPLRQGLKKVQALDCRYIVQIGDPGGHTQTGLFSEAQDALSASEGFDLMFGYRNHTTAMNKDELRKEVQKFAEGARRVREAGADGVEVTASKGYIIHQFLNPATNRRSDEYGGSVEKRFRLLRDIVGQVRAAVGQDCLAYENIELRHSLAGSQALHFLTKSD
jgi:2,4-dienoyl-CoA reductase-like NADH-dependent reductase (Old Yellow Enzyme family)